jgi:hypothetical protein
MFKQLNMLATEEQALAKASAKQIWEVYIDNGAPRQVSPFNTHICTSFILYATLVLGCCRIVFLRVCALLLWENDAVIETTQYFSLYSRYTQAESSISNDYRRLIFQLPYEKASTGPYSACCPYQAIFSNLQKNKFVRFSKILSCATRRIRKDSVHFWTHIK